MLADVVGYSRLMSVDEDRTHERIASLMTELIDSALSEYGGRVIKNTGDGMLAEFGSALGAVRCGLDIQQRLGQPQHQGQDDPIQLRIGINTGDVIFGDRDVYGHSINITARLESIAHPGSVCVSQSIYDQTSSQPGLNFNDKGLHRVKNIADPIRVFEVSYGRASSIRKRNIPRIYGALAASVVIAVLATGIFAAVGSNRNLRTDSILVLPFRNLSNNAEDEYFADAITDDVTTDLSRLSRAFVIASATALTYKGHAVDVRTIGRDCDVRYLLQGTVRRIERAIQINVQLIDAFTGGNIWADRFIYETTTLQGLEEAITGRIGAALSIQPVRYTESREAGTLAADHNPLDERLRAMALILGPPTPEKYMEARRDVEECLRLDPNSAKCWALLSRILMSDYLNSWNGAGLAEVERAEKAYKRALEIEPANAVAHYAAGFVRRVRNDHDGALSEFQKAVDADKNFAAAHAQIANELVFLGQAKEAVTTGQTAVRLSPRDPSIGVFYWVIGRAYFTNEEYGNAATWLTKSVDQRPNLWFNRAWLVSANALTGEHAAARVTLADLQQKFPTYTLARIKEVYTRENQYENETIKAAREHLFRGLLTAGLT